MVDLALIFMRFGGAFAVLCAMISLSIVAAMLVTTPARDFWRECRDARFLIGGCLVALVVGLFLIWGSFHVQP